MKDRRHSPDRIKKMELELPDASICYYPDFLDTATADHYFQTLLEKTPWRQDDIKIFGKVYPQPRLTALYGEAGKPYSYSGIIMQPLPFTPLLRSLKEAAEDVSAARFSTVLLNLYRDGSDSNGWHADDEKELGKDPVIASISLGEPRKFKLRHKQNKDLRTDLELGHGSLLLMAGRTQHYWKHQLPKTARQIGPRINLTYRLVHTS